MQPNHQPSPGRPVYHRVLSRFFKIVWKTTKYIFYFALFYFAWKGFMSWR